MNQSNSTARSPTRVTTGNAIGQRKRRNDRGRTSMENPNVKRSKTENRGREEPVDYITLTSSDEDDEVVYEGTFYNPPNETTTFSNRENDDVQVSGSVTPASVLSGILSPKRKSTSQTTTVNSPANTQPQLSMTPIRPEIPVLQKLTAQSSLENTPPAQLPNVASSKKSVLVEEPASARQTVEPVINHIEEDQLENVDFDTEPFTSSTVNSSFVQNRSPGRSVKNSGKTSEKTIRMAKKEATEERRKWLAENARKRQPLLKALRNNVPEAMKKLEEFDKQCDQENRNRLRKVEYEAERLGSIGVERRSILDHNTPITYSIDEVLETRLDEESRKMSKEAIKKQVEMLIGWNPKQESFIRFAFSEIYKAIDATFETYSSASLFFADLAQKVKENSSEYALPVASVEDTVHHVERMLRQFPGKSIRVDSAIFKLALRFDAKKNYKSLFDLYNHMSED